MSSHEAAKQAHQDALQALDAAKTAVTAALKKAERAERAAFDAGVYGVSDRWTDVAEQLASLKHDMPSYERRR